ncbi:MAG: acylphosphatase [Nocardioides sp.]
MSETRADRRVGADRSRRRFEVSGLVQGVGFRPFVYVTASELGLSGTVANASSGVVIEVEGDSGAVAEFGRRLVADAPPMAAIESVRAAVVAPRGGNGFSIEGSASGEGRTLASPDVALCDECLAELIDPGDRRYRHPFITCTNCGPRFTIITGLPYDRASTTMAGFAMCEACRREYDDPRDRRFHAQPIACPDCGPTLQLVGGPGRADLRETGDSALRRACALLAEGRIVAVKGLGGYHLAVDARNEDAVAELRRRKRRGDKPFAVMARDVATCERLVEAGRGRAPPADRVPQADRAAAPAAARRGRPLRGAGAPTWA